MSLFLSVKYLSHTDKKRLISHAAAFVRPFFSINGAHLLPRIGLIDSLNPAVAEDLNSMRGVIETLTCEMRIRDKSCGYNDYIL